jgi:hypothetical protein
MLQEGSCPIDMVFFIPELFVPALPRTWKDENPLFVKYSNPGCNLKLCLLSLQQQCHVIMLHETDRVPSYSPIVIQWGVIRLLTLLSGSGPSYIPV